MPTHRRRTARLKCKTAFDWVTQDRCTIPCERGWEGSNAPASTGAL